MTRRRAVADLRTHAFPERAHAEELFMNIRIWFCRSALALVGVICPLVAAASERDFTPTDRADVIEKLAPRGAPLSAMTDPALAARAARDAISLAREQADPRFLGRAQAILARWWDQPHATPEIATLQATILQNRHEFGAARQVLKRVLTQPASPALAQAWLTLASLDRLEANYPAALAACAQVARSGAAFHAQACSAETLSLQGKRAIAQQSFDQLMAKAPDAGTQAWILSLYAEHLERIGDNDLALRQYLSSLQLAPDVYTALAAADLLLHRGEAARAIAVLAGQPDSDAILIRRTHARKLLKDPAWLKLDALLKERFAALDARADEQAAHARERALYHLWIDGDKPAALRFAQLNLAQQREPVDWWLALKSAEQAGQARDIAGLLEALRQTGLQDVRLTRPTTAVALKGSAR